MNRIAPSLNHPDGRPDELDQSPLLADAHADLAREVPYFMLDRLQRAGRELEVVGMHELEVR